MSDLDIVLDEAKQAMDKSLEGLKRDLSKIRTGRANPALIEGVSVDYYGTPTPLKSLATLNAPEARLLTIQPFDPSAMTEIERAILKADLGLSPANDGKVLRIPIPELTEERRRELVKQVKKLGEDHKLGIRGARRDAIAMLKEMEKDGDLTEDESRRGQKRVQELTDGAVEETDATVTGKEGEILKI